MHVVWCHFFCTIIFAFFWISGAAQYPRCNGTISRISDGLCDPSNNNIDCDYDGGDCCECTCLQDRLYPCGFDGFKCQDPLANDDTNKCQNTTSSSPACSEDDAVQEWVVDNSSTARALAEAVNCTGGTFKVTWKGRVIVDRTIYVAEDTTVYLTGTDSGSEVDGGGNIRIFTLVNASLHVANVTFRNGNATYGGAIAVVGSSTTLKHSTFINNVASSVGGAFYIDRDSLVTLYGQVTFAGNSAGSRGGALVAARDSSVLGHGPTSFFNNTANDMGGAVYIREDSAISWSAKSSFVNNSADFISGFGGALVVEEGSNVSWSAETSFVNNMGGFGGALYVGDSSSVSWTAESSFFGNVAGNYGGTMFIYNCSRASWSAATSFIYNIGGFGGAFFIYHSSDVSWVAETSFIDNTANWSGGALFVGGESSASWMGESFFVNNNAGVAGGAVFLYNGSRSSWGSETSFASNSAVEYGGVLFVYDNSQVSWIKGDLEGALGVAETTFINNVAAKGGGAHVTYNSKISWSAETSFFNNTGRFGGALFIEFSSNGSWTGGTTFINNVASSNGGALHVDFGGSIWWNGATSFTDNAANINGGALYVELGSSVSWQEISLFKNNTALYNGGAFYVRNGCNIWWSGATLFTDNTANRNGGTMCIRGGCSVSWEGMSTYTNNIALEHGGALFVYNASTISWTRDTFFGGNIAHIHGGALVIANGSSAFSEASTTFFNNSASSYSGGAVIVYQNSDITWRATTSFISNTAGSSGGGLTSLIGSAVTMQGETVFLDNVAGNDGGATYIYHSDNQGWPLLTINNKTMFSRNRCGVNGGGMALIGSVAVSLATVNMTFFRNVANVAGGGMYVSGVVFGPTFVGTRFVSNSAEIGGGVYTAGSGIALATSDQLGVPESQDPFTYILCEFIGNRASTRGGALDSGAGIDLIVNTTFLGNTAGSGGALRLAGDASLDRCHFIENSSGEEKGPAVYNEGLISSISNCSFINNVFSCESNHFFAYDELDVVIDAVCKDCGECEDCDFDGKLPVCVQELDHSSSPGGNTTIEVLSIEHGYWRVSNTSINILPCYNTNACRGGVTGAQDYCLEGYEGPYCSVCSEGYTSSLGSFCTKCPDTNDLGVALVAVFGIVVVAFCAAFVAYMLSGQEASADRGFVARISRFIPLHSLKIVIVVWQILTQVIMQKTSIFLCYLTAVTKSPFCNVTKISFHDIYKRFLERVDFLNFDFSWVISTGCIVHIDFHDRLLISTLGPMIGMAILGATYTVAIYKHRGFEAACHIVHRKHLSMVLLLSFLVYSSVSTTVFTMFVCDDLDDGSSYLSADYRIDCDSFTHEALQIYASFMIVLYAIGIPAFFTYLLFSNRYTLTKDTDRQNNSAVTPFADLWKPYKPRCFFYEVVECCRRVLLTGAIVFIDQDSAAQIAVALVMATTFFIFSEALAPYASAWDSWISRMGHAIVVTSMFLALLLKVDVSQEEAESQKVFEAVLVVVHVIMILVVSVESGAMIVAWRIEAVREDPQPRSTRQLGCVSFANRIRINSLNKTHRVVGKRFRIRRKSHGVDVES